MTSIPVFSVFKLVIGGLIISLATGQPSTGYSNSANVGDKSDRSNIPRTYDENSVLLCRSSLANCVADAQSFESRRDGKEDTFKISLLPMETSAFEDRFFMPMGRYRSKKAQKAILLDVGDYVVKGNGSPMMDSLVGGQTRTAGFGGILRSSGK